MQLYINISFLYYIASERNNPVLATLPIDPLTQRISHVCGMDAIDFYDGGFFTRN